MIDGFSDFFEKIIAAAHNRITRVKGKEYAPTNSEILEVLDTEVLRTDKENGRVDFVSLESAVKKLEDVYSTDVSVLLKEGHLLQNSYAYYKMMTKQY